MAGTGSCERCSGRGRKVGDPGNRCRDCGGTGGAQQERPKIVPPKQPPPPVMLSGGKKKPRQNPAGHYDHGY